MVRDTRVYKTRQHVEPSAPPLEDDYHEIARRPMSYGFLSSSDSQFIGAKWKRSADPGNDQFDSRDAGSRNFPEISPISMSLPSSSSSSISSASNSVSIVPVGRRAARFEFNSIKLNQKSHQNLIRRRFNPILLTRRGCTDVFCSVLFMVFLFGWAVVAFVAMLWGRPERLIHPTDSRGRMCGHYRPNAYDLRSRPYLLFFDLTKCASYVTILTGCPTRQICVEKCPSEYFSYLQLQRGRSPSEFHDAVNEHIVCDDALVDKARIFDFIHLKALVDQGLCTAYTVKSAAVVGRCLPQILTDFASKLNHVHHQFDHFPLRDAVSASMANHSLNRLIQSLGDDGGAVPSDQKLGNSSGRVMHGIVHEGGMLEKIAADLSVSWWQILSFWALAAFVCLLYAILLRILGGFMIYISIFVLLIILSSGTTFSWIRYKTLVDEGAINDYSFQPMAELYLEMPNTWLIIGVLFSVMFAIVLIVFLFVRSRIRLAVALIEETSKALGNLLSTLLFPFFPFLLHVGVFALWGSVTIWLSSSGEENCRRMNFANPMELENGERCDCRLLGAVSEPLCRYVNLTRNEQHIMALQAYNLFALFWTSCFVSALADITVAGAFAAHYFAFQKPKDVPSYPVLRSLGRSLRYHIGTLAFGALVLSIVKFLKVILDFVYNRLKNAENRVAKFIYRALSCLFYCLETFLRFLSRNAYIMTAIYGKGFCRSARDSFNLLTRNVVRVVVLNRITAFLLFVGKVSITCGMGVFSYYYFKGEWVIDGFPQIYLYNLGVPVVAVMIGTYFVCDLFLDVYEMGVDTTFLCFLEDSETNDGSVEKPFYMSDNLKKILGKENKF